MAACNVVSISQQQVKDQHQQMTAGFVHQDVAGLATSRAVSVHLALKGSTQVRGARWIRGRNGSEVKHETVQWYGEDANIHSNEWKGKALSFGACAWPVQSFAEFGACAWPVQSLVYVHGQRST